MKAVYAALALAGFALARSAGAQDVDLHGYLDCRLVARSSERSWTDGGLGKTRFGDGGVAPICAQAAVVGTWQVTPDILGLADVQVATTGRDALSVLEAYLRYRPVSITPLRSSLKLGAFFPPISLENDAIGWTSPWTLTPSAINSWIGEELRTIGAEAQLEWRGTGHSIEGVAALVRNNDPAGELMAARGWSLSDLTSGIGSRVREPDVYALDNHESVPLRFDPFLENDGRLGWYAGATWRAPGRGRVSLLRYDNEADPTTHSGGASPVFSWHTQFWSLGAEADAGRLVLLAQAMSGSTEIAPSPDFSTSTDFRAAYVLAGWNLGAWRAAVRIDAFSTEQLPRSLSDRVRGHGNAGTLALDWRPFDWLRLSGEWLHLRSSRNQRLEEGLPERATDNQLQLSARVLF
ncbi:MAG TPA: hypothetical protein VFG55_06530 [Rhodanobacteraceae bacterium]|nr:hypothetical protein [Rhodanobacteraceae bacterium]